MKQLASAQAGITLLLCAAFAVRLAAAIGWQTQLPDESRFGFADSESYWVLAQTIARGDTYQFGDANARVFRTPGYPAVLACMFTIVGNNPPSLWARVLGALLGTVAVGGVFWLAQLLFDRSAAWLASWVAVLYPGAISMSVLILSEALFCPLMILQLGLMVLACRSPKIRPAVIFALLAGLLAGAATLARPSWLCFTPLAAVVYGLADKRRARSWVCGATMLLGMVLAMLPWWIRNYSVTGHFVPTTLQVGASLYDGWNPHANGGSDMRFVARLTREGTDAWQNANPREESLEYYLDRYMQREAITWAHAHTGQVIGLAGRKLQRLWSPWPNAEEFQNWRIKLLFAASFIPVAVTSFYGIVHFSRQGGLYFLCWLPALYFTILHSIFVSSIRYRQPAMLLLIVFASATLITMFRAWRVRNRTLP